MTQPKIGIVIPVSKGEVRLKDTLYYFKHRTTLPYKVVVCSTHEGEYEDICKSYNADLIITRTSLGEAKNLGAAHLIDSDILVFADAHVKVDPGWDTEIANLLSDKTVGIATLNTYILSSDFKTENRWQGGAGFKFNYDFKREWCGADKNGEVVWINGAFQAFRKTAFWKIGGFIPFHEEDLAISLASQKLGYRNVCGTEKVGHVFKVGKNTLAYNPINDFNYGDLLIAYLYFPPEEYEKAKAKKNYSPELVRYIETNFEKLKIYVEDNAGKGPLEEDMVLKTKDVSLISAYSPARAKIKLGLMRCLFPRVYGGLTPRVENVMKPFPRLTCVLE